ALSGCSTTTDHHYVFPSGAGGLLEAEIEVAAQLGLRFHPCRGSMDLGHSKGGLPPDSVVEDVDTILAATDDAIGRFHDPAPGSMLRIAVGPCSPFSVSPQLMRESAALARRRGVRLHTHIAETLDAGVNVGLAVDGSASNDSGNLLAEARQALLTTRARKGASAMTAREALRVVTRGGAACLGRDDIGSIEVGKRADVALFAVDGLA